ncbi:response regulator [Azonexus hydrophilus]|uniref:response regulator n=1 Tax=Azonexus hydrophilus TaxID=418702 RepID=UPI00147BCF3B|nr:response regulator [Azonexus hydrophilus]
MALTTSLTDLGILLVEPSQMQAHVVTRMLENQGVRRIAVVTAGAAALDSLRGGGGEGLVVISSMYLPDMAGTDLVTAMRADPDLESIPFILVSSETRPQVLEPVRQSGACSIVAKPFTEQQLSRALYAAADYLNPPEDIDVADIEGLRVLVVDDSIASRHHLRRLLEELGIERITECVDGKQAVGVLQESMFDLVITDYNMPEMDGRELTEYIRTQSWQAEVPVLMVTSEQNMGRLAAVERAGVSAICDKPFEASSIRRLISDALRR